MKSSTFGLDLSVLNVAFSFIVKTVFSGHLTELGNDQMTA